ncbi:hypothetical protein BCR33DRAFT_718883, partial [Rhizoclosmatium globosum]
MYKSMNNSFMNVCKAHTQIKSEARRSRLLRPAVNPQFKTYPQRLKVYEAYAFFSLWPLGVIASDCVVFIAARSLRVVS